MKKIVFLLPFLFCQAAGANEMMVTLNVNRLCATIVQIPYASDNFSNEEWDQFQQCLRFVRQFDGVQ
jgi:uncharacterized membrane protein